MPSLLRFQRRSDFGLPVSGSFLDAVTDAVARARQHPDEAVRFAASQVPIYAQHAPDTRQARAGGCPYCTYLGLWADVWAGYDPSPHGIIWLFEDGISKTAERFGRSLQEQVDETLLHEIDHALQRDHILEKLNQTRGEVTAHALHACG